MILSALDPSPSSPVLTPGASPPPSALHLYGTALATVLAATLLRFALTPLIGPTNVPFITYYPAVVFASWTGGLKSGLFSLLLSVFTAAYLFLPPAFAFAAPGSADTIALITFLLSGLGIALLGEAQHRAVHHSEEQTRQARKHAQEAEQRGEALRKEQTQITTILASITDGFVAVDSEWRYIYVNARAESILRKPKEELLGRAMWEVYPSAVKTEGYGHLQRAMRERISLTYRAYSAPATGWVDVHVYPADGGLAIYFQDVTAEVEAEEGRKQAQAQLLQAQKLESIGRLAGGIAHDFNNLLTVIVGYAELAEAEISPESPVQKDLQQIRTASERAANLTRQLLAFARKQVIEPKVLDLNALILDLDKMLRRLIGEDIELTTLSFAALGTVMADPGQIEQILVNLAVNARDAMPEGGKLTIETANVTLDAEYADQHSGVTEGDWVMFSVSDTGMGMDESIQQHVFEPFFTTKESGKGTGLGLATCYGIVKQAGGHIWLYSEPGKGATFKIYLPRVDASRETKVEAKPVGRPRGYETILLVEDDLTVLNLASSALRRQGYVVLTASNGVAALETAREYGGKIDLLMTDVIMPQMGGKELVQQLQADYPGLKVLYSSGYTDDAIVQHGVLDAGVAFLQKPFTPTTLAQKVRATLDTDTSSR